MQNGFDDFDTQLQAEDVHLSDGYEDALEYYLSEGYPLDIATEYATRDVHTSTHGEH
jgi:hypothetical protein